MKWLFELFKTRKPKVGEMWIPYSHQDDPWISDSNCYEIVDIKNGWVRFGTSGCLTRSMDDFLRVYTFYKDAK